MKKSEFEYKVHEAAHADRVKAIENHQQAMGKAVAGDPAHSFLKAEIARHEVMRDHHADMMEECSKAVTSELEKSQRVQPDRVSAIAPPRAIPRTGQRELPERPNVPIALEKFVSIPDDDEG